MANSSLFVRKWKAKVRDAEKLAKTLSERLHECSEADLQKLTSVIKPCEVGATPFAGWVIIEPRGLESLTYITDDGELRCLVELTFARNEEDAPVGVPYFMPWRDVPIESESWANMLRIALLQMANAFNRLQLMNPR